MEKVKSKKELFKALAEGKKVKRDCWNNDEYIQLQNEDIIDEGGDTFCSGMDELIVCDDWVYYNN